MRHSIEAAVKNGVIEHGPGWCFTAMHFADLGSDVSIRIDFYTLGAPGLKCARKRRANQAPRFAKS